ncbi:MAG: 4Fe-4S binding protein [Clostridia bacterium]|nr:4Fe-4S binding protein [Clostridia bacterium]
METKEKPTLSGEQLKRNKREHMALRAAIQFFFFIAMPGAFVAGFNGIKSIFESIHSGAPIEMNSFIWALILVSAFTVVFSRFFCGYICAFGSFGDFIHWLSGIIQKKLFKREKQFELPEKASKILRLLKYLNLAFIVIFVFFGLYSKLRGTNAWDVFSIFSSLSFKLGGLTVGIILFIAVIVLMAIKERGFCQFLCPLGAFFSLLPMLGILRRDKEGCIKNCEICRKNCPVSLKLEEDGFNSGECVGCDKCAAACPRGNLAHPEKKLLRSELAAVLIKAALFFILGSLIGLCRFF